MNPSVCSVTFLALTFLLQEPQGQNPELSILQVHLSLWCAECADREGAGHVVSLVLCASLSPALDPALQRSF